MKTVRTIIGIIVAVALLAVAGFFGYSQLVEKGIIHTDKKDTVSNRYEIPDAFRDICMISNVSKVTVCPANDTKVTLEVIGIEGIEYEYRFEPDGMSNMDTLVIEEKDRRTGIGKLLPVTESLEIRLFLPKTDAEGTERSFGGLKITTKTGDCDVSDVPVGWVEVFTFSGKVEISSITSIGPVGANTESGNVTFADISAQDCGASTSTGNIEFRNIVAKDGGLMMITESGSVTFEDCDSILESYLRTKTGNVRGTLLTGKAFVTETVLGKIEIPESEGTVPFIIETTTGNIVIEVKK
jgi:DUF4097 and DUF4098 domain-containing protein YvlB